MAIPITLNEVYAYVHREEGRREVMNPAPSIEKSTLISSSSNGHRGSFMRRGHSGRSTPLFDDRNRLKCEHCGQF